LTEDTLKNVNLLDEFLIYQGAYCLSHTLKRISKVLKTLIVMNSVAHGECSNSF